MYNTTKQCPKLTTRDQYPTAATKRDSRNPTHTPFNPELHPDYSEIIQEAQEPRRYLISTTKQIEIAPNTLKYIVTRAVNDERKNSQYHQMMQPKTFSAHNNNQGWDKLIIPHAIYTLQVDSTYHIPIVNTAPTTIAIPKNTIIGTIESIELPFPQQNHYTADTIAAVHTHTNQPHLPTRATNNNHPRRQGNTTN